MKLTNSAGQSEHAVKDLKILDYAPAERHSRWGIASVCMAAAVWIFAILAGVFYITPFESRGNEKETKVAMMAGILGVLLGICALQDRQHKRILGIIGLILNAAIIPLAWLFLPFT
jgi:uncharacterized membrane protein HdeD (DUF308 family)